MTTTDQLIAARVRAKNRIKVLEELKHLRTVADAQELAEWRAVKRKLDREIKKRIVQLPLF